MFFGSVDVPLSAIAIPDSASLDIMHTVHLKLAPPPLRSLANNASTV